MTLPKSAQPYTITETCLILVVILGSLQMPSCPSATPVDWKRELNGARLCLKTCDEVASKCVKACVRRCTRARWGSRARQFPAYYESLCERTADKFLSCRLCVHSRKSRCLDTETACTDRCWAAVGVCHKQQQQH